MGMGAMLIIFIFTIYKHSWLESYTLHYDTLNYNIIDSKSPSMTICGVTKKKLSIL